MNCLIYLIPILSYLIFFFNGDIYIIGLLKNYYIYADMYTINQKINNQLSIWLIIMFWFVSIMIVVGGLTRLTDSGLSITRWELFSGVLPPLNQSEWILYFNLYKETTEFKLQNFNMTIDDFKVIFWWEWAHRFLGRLIGIGYLIPLLYFSLRIKLSKLFNLYLIFFLYVFRDL